MAAAAAGVPTGGSFVAMPSSYGAYGGATYGGYGGYPAQTMSYAQPSYGYQQSYATTPSYTTVGTQQMPSTGIGATPLMAYVPGGATYTATDAKPAAAPVKRAVKKGKAG